MQFYAAKFSVKTFLLTSFILVVGSGVGAPVARAGSAHAGQWVPLGSAGALYHRPPSNGSDHRAPQPHSLLIQDFNYRHASKLQLHTSKTIQPGFRSLHRCRYWIAQAGGASASATLGAYLYFAYIFVREALDSVLGLLEFIVYCWAAGFIHGFTLIKNRLKILDIVRTKLFMESRTKCLEHIKRQPLQNGYLV